MVKRNKKEVVESLLIVLLSLVIFLIIMAGYIKIDKYKKSQYKLDTRFETNDIVSITNKLPIADDIGKAYSGTGMENNIEGYSVFSITNPNDKKVNYEIYITKTNLYTNEIKSNYIKMYLTDENNNPLDGYENNKIKSYYDLYSLSDKPGSRLVYSGNLVSGGEKRFILRTWVSDTYVLSKEEEGFSYNIDVRIK